MPKRRMIESIAAAGLLLASCVVAGCGGERSPVSDDSIVRPAKIITVGEAGSDSRTYPGRVQAAQRVQLSFRVSGPVVEVKVTKGQRVSAGSILARIDTRDYRVQALNLEAQMAAVRAQHIQAEEEYQRVRGLYEHDNASKSDFDRARAALDVGKAQVEATEQALEAARLSLADTELKAPYAGIVADRFVEAHQTVAAGQPVVAFQGVGDMEVLIDVPEREVADLTKKAPKAILVQFDAVATGEQFAAQVKEFATETDRQTQTFPVTLKLNAQPTSDLLPGMTASVRWMVGNGHDKSIVVPLASVITDEGGQAFVWRVESETMTLKRVPVTTGTLTESGLEITTGLEGGDQILAAGVHFVREGQLVRALDGE